MEPCGHFWHSVPPRREVQDQPEDTGRCRPGPGQGQPRTTPRASKGEPTFITHVALSEGTRTGRDSRVPRGAWEHKPRDSQPPDCAVENGEGPTGASRLGSRT